MRAYALALAAACTLLTGTTLAAQTPAKPVAKPQTAARPATAQSQTPAKPAGLTNQNVIDLVKAGSGDELVLTYLASQPAKAFDLSPQGMVALKTAGVSDRVISAMLGQPLPSTPAPIPASAPKPAGVAESKTTPPPSAGPRAASVGKDNVMQPHEAGIYTFVSGKLVMLEPGVSTSAGTDGKSMMGSAATMGFKKIKMKAAIPGRKADARVPDQTEFYFYGSSFNPNQYVLARLEANDTNRQIVVGEGGMLGVKVGIRDEDQVRVQISKLDSGIYKVVVDKPLTPGEYAFLNMSQLNSPSLWAFGVDR